MTSGSDTPKGRFVDDFTVVLEEVAPFVIHPGWFIQDGEDPVDLYVVVYTGDGKVQGRVPAFTSAIQACFEGAQVLAYLDAHKAAEASQEGTEALLTSDGPSNDDFIN